MTQENNGQNIGRTNQNTQSYQDVANQVGGQALQLVELGGDEQLDVLAPGLTEKLKQTENQDNTEPVISLDEKYADYDEAFGDVIPKERKTFTNRRKTPKNHRRHVPYR